VVSIFIFLCVVTDPLDDVVKRGDDQDVSDDELRRLPRKRHRQDHSPASSSPEQTPIRPVISTSFHITNDYLSNFSPTNLKDPFSNSGQPNLVVLVDYDRVGANDDVSVRSSNVAPVVNVGVPAVSASSRRNENTVGSERGE
jgi:hypothetical protein